MTRHTSKWPVHWVFVIVRGAHGFVHMPLPLHPMPRAPLQMEEFVGAQMELVKMFEKEVIIDLPPGHPLLPLSSVRTRLQQVAALALCRATLGPQVARWSHGRCSWVS